MYLSLHQCIRQYLLWVANSAALLGVAVIALFCGMKLSGAKSIVRDAQLLLKLLMKVMEALLSTERRG